jgi:hypothetical protein
MAGSREGVRSCWWVKGGGEELPVPPMAESKEEAPVVGAGVGGCWWVKGGVRVAGGRVKGGGGCLSLLRLAAGGSREGMRAACPRPLPLLFTLCLQCRGTIIMKISRYIIYDLSGGANLCRANMIISITINTSFP